ncbi:DUF4097 family beta strand repeat-containing protein [Psychrobacillus sp. NPDC096426]|uniref:DUF4097 family beta strand repeat-containing protein n=1 Tax=Psychrobacillus sp. NPDC096426 TaxID=3364491 RepID=UPI003813FF23
MKKVIISLLIVIIVIGLSSFLFLRFPFEKVSVAEEREIEVNDKSLVTVQSNSADIKIIPTSTDKVIVTLKGVISKELEEQYQLNIVENKDKLDIRYLRKDDSLGITSGMEKDVCLTVSLPQKVYNELIIQSVSGDIKAEKFKAENLELESISGDVTLQEFQSEGFVSIQSTSGEVILEQNEINQYSIQTSSGRVDLNAVTSLDGLIKTKSGKVTVTSKTINNTLDITTTSGDISTIFEENPESITLNYKGTSGKPNINLEGIVYKSKDEHSIVGIIGDGDKKITVESTSGDFTAK